MPARLLIILCLATVAGAQSGLVINEIQTGLTDWVEVANTGTVHAALGGYRLRFSATSGGPVMFTFAPGANLAPGATLVVTDDATLVNPAVGAGTQKLYAGVNIPWSTTAAGSTTAGACALTTGGDIGIDRVRWNNPTDPLAFGMPFTGTVIPTASGLGRNANADSDSPLEWVSLTEASASPGSLNPGQSAPTQGVSLIYSTLGTGDFAGVITTSLPPTPGAEFYQLVSLQDAMPNGTGPLFGVMPDALSTALTPLAPGNPFHDTLNQAGGWALTAPPGTIPAGMHLEGVALVVQNGAITRISPVATLTF